MKQPFKQSITFQIPCIDGKGAPVTGRIEIGQGVEIFLDGYGLQEMEPGYGSLIYLENYNGRVSASIWPDIRSGDAKTIGLEKAKEERREEEISADTEA